MVQQQKQNARQHSRWTVAVMVCALMVAALFGMLTLLPVLVAWTGLFRRRAAPPPDARSQTSS